MSFRASGRNQHPDEEGIKTLAPARLVLVGRVETNTLMKKGLGPDTCRYSQRAPSENPLVDWSTGRLTQA